MRYDLSHYGWIVILILVLSLLISLATPFGEYVYNSTDYITNAFLGVTYKALKLDRPILGGEDCFYADDYGVLRIKPKYEKTYIPRIIGETALENNISVKETCKYLEYIVFTGESPEYNEWLELGISDKKMNQIIGAYYANEFNIKEIVDTALQEHPYMETPEQVMLNYIYSIFVENCSDVPGLTYDGHNVTRSELNQLAAQIATFFHESALEEARAAFPGEEDIDILIQKMVLSSLSGNDVNLPNYKKSTIRKYTDDFGIDPILINLYENLFTVLLKNPEKATPDDLICIAASDFVPFTVDELIDLTKDVPVCDYNKAFLTVPYVGGFTVDTVERNAYNSKLPSRFNIPESYNDIEITTIPAELFYDYNDYDFIEAVHLPSTIKTIDNRAFKYCRNLEQINLENVSWLGGECFCHTKLTHIELSPELRTIPSEAFYDTPLKYIKINHGTQSIQGSAFSGCYDIELMYIPNSVTAFQGVPYSSKLIIYTPSGSPAETYAKEHNIAFVNATSVPDYYEVLRK